MAEYCEVADVETRLRTGGAEYVNEGNSLFLPQAIAHAGNEIDFAIAEQISPASARAQANTFLAKICIDLAVVRCFGGDNCPETLLQEAEVSRGHLKRIADGQRIPDFVYPSQPSGDPKYDTTATAPLVVNPGKPVVLDSLGRLSLGRRYY